jgi:hypothetical protein
MCVNSGGKLEKIVVRKYNRKVYVLVNGGAFYGWYKKYI